MKKVLFSIGNLVGGGAERVVSVWSGVLAEKGYEVAIHIAYRTDGEYPVNDKVHIECTAPTQDAYMALPSLKRLLLKRKFIQKWKPEVVISFLPNNQIRMLLVAAGIRMRRVETIRINPWRSPCNEKLWKLCFRRADAIILQTEDQKDYLPQKDQKKCTVIRNPLAEVYKTAEGRKYGEKATSFIAAGRLDAQKNFPMLIEAFARVAKDDDTLTLDIYGRGSDEYTAYLQECIDKSGASQHITLKGRTNDMCGALLQNDCFIMSSDYEGMPNALAEAMATGMVCISTDCKTGPRDMIENGKNGYLSKTADADDMEKAIRQVLAMSSVELEAMGNAARESILELCDDEKNIKKLIGVIEG